MWLVEIYACLRMIMKKRYKYKCKHKFEYKYERKHKYEYKYIITFPNSLAQVWHLTVTAPERAPAPGASSDES